MPGKAAVLRGGWHLAIVVVTWVLAFTAPLLASQVAFREGGSEEGLRCGRPPTVPEQQIETQLRAAFPDCRGLSFEGRSTIVFEDKDEQERRLFYKVGTGGSSADLSLLQYEAEGFRDWRPRPGAARRSEALAHGRSHARLRAAACRASLSWTSSKWVGAAGRKRSALWGRGLRRSTARRRARGGPPAASGSPWTAAAGPSPSRTTQARRR